jgi:hypothetical protein
MFFDHLVHINNKWNPNFVVNLECSEKHYFLNVVIMF